MLDKTPIQKLKKSNRNCPDNSAGGYVHSVFKFSIYGLIKTTFHLSKDVHFRKHIHNSNQILSQTFHYLLALHIPSQTANKRPTQSTRYCICSHNIIVLRYKTPCSGPFSPIQSFKCSFLQGDRFYLI